MNRFRSAVTLMLLVVAGALALFSAARPPQPAQAQAFSGQWLVEFPDDRKSYACAVYQYPQGFKTRLVCRPLQPGQKKK
ncbi:MAG: hypothetical protein E6H02_07605 [Bacillati bacterium ANGP1]|uniref:Uncharacterized protein n=1 Tax=Candidatus Segetimicrobium genomatis TaxID=2569760 RepID=A0A537LS11_9BACT|nr:MAG: hypothetical protein E6H02_07605 [Terrabacteria group bacterium ANGP1]